MQVPQLLAAFSVFRCLQVRSSDYYGTVRFVHLKTDDLPKERSLFKTLVNLSRHKGV